MDSGTTAYTFHLVQPLFDSPYYELENTQAEATPGEAIQGMRDAEDQILQQKVAVADGYVNAMLNTVTLGMSLENVGMQGAFQLGPIPGELPAGIVAERQTANLSATEIIAQAEAKGLQHNRTNWCFGPDLARTAWPGASVCDGKRRHHA